MTDLDQIKQSSFAAMLERVVAILYRSVRLHVPCMQYLRRVKPAALIVGLAVVATGCSSSGSPGTQGSKPSSSASSVTAGVCASLTTTVNAAARASWKSPSETDNGTLHNCSFGPSDQGVLTVQIADGESHAGFLDNRQIVASSGTVESLSGVGDEAYTQTLNGAILIAARQGDVGVVVQLQDGTEETALAVARAALTVLGK